MALVSAIAIYFLIWWLVLFAVLPFGVSPQTDSEDGYLEGTAPSAPRHPLLLRKMLATSLIAGIIYAALVWVYRAGVITYDSIPFLPQF